MRDPKIITIAEDGLVTFGWTGEDADEFDLLLQQFCILVLSISREYPWGTIIGGDTDTLAHYNVRENDTSELALELGGRISAIVDKIKSEHPDLISASLEGLEYNKLNDKVTARIAVRSIYGVRYIRLSLMDTIGELD